MFSCKETIIFRAITYGSFVQCFTFVIYQWSWDLAWCIFGGLIMHAKLRAYKPIWEEGLRIWLYAWCLIFSLRKKRSLSMTITYETKPKNIRASRISWCGPLIETAVIGCLLISKCRNIESRMHSDCWIWPHSVLYSLQIFKAKQVTYKTGSASHHDGWPLKFGLSMQSSWWNPTHCALC